VVFDKCIFFNRLGDASIPGILFIAEVRLESGTNVLPCTAVILMSGSNELYNEMTRDSKPLKYRKPQTMRAPVPITNSNHGDHGPRYLLPAGDFFGQKIAVWAIKSGEVQSKRSFRRM
jgi:hypothetical protein